MRQFTDGYLCGKRQVQHVQYFLRGGGHDERSKQSVSRTRSLPSAQHLWKQQHRLPGQLVTVRGDGSCFYRCLQHFQPLPGGASEWRYRITSRYGSDYAEEPDVIRGLQMANFRATILAMDVENPNMIPFIFEEGPLHGTPIVLVNTMSNRMPAPIQ